MTCTTNGAPLDDSGTPLFYIHHGQTAEIVLNQPERLNAMTADMWHRLDRIVSLLSEDNQLRCIVVKGAGGKAFCPGCDIFEFESIRYTAEQGKVYGKIMHDAFTAMQNCPIPLIAQIQGVCVGGGLDIAALCDLRICGKSSRFGIPIKNLGIVMAYEELSPILEITHKNTMLEMLLTGRIYNAEEAFERHLVTRVIEDDALEAIVQKTVADIVSGAPLSARWHKSFLRNLVSGKTLTETDRDVCYECYDTDDYHAGCEAFKVHRRAVFRGNNSY